MKCFVENIAALFKVKSIVTIAMTVGMLLMITGHYTPPQEVFALFSTTYGAVITYFFTRKDNKEGKE